MPRLLPAASPPTIRRRIRSQCAAPSGPGATIFPAASHRLTANHRGRCCLLAVGRSAALPAQTSDRRRDIFSTSTPFMPAPDPNSIRRAIEQFQPRRRPRFQNLLPWRAEVLALRGKGASCEAIADLLNQHGVRTSRTMVNEFLLSLSETKSRRRKRLLQPVAPAITPAPDGLSASPPLQPATPVRRADSEAAPAKSRGPRIAQVELLNPNET
jgi:hypothetical protein